MQTEKPDTPVAEKKVTLVNKSYLQIKAMGFEEIGKLSSIKFPNPKAIADHAKLALPAAIVAHNAAKGMKRTRDTATLESSARGIVNELLRLIKGYDKLSLSAVDKSDDSFILSRETGEK